MEGVESRRWDADTYDRASDVQEAWGLAILHRLPLRGDETVLDAGCGSGRVTAHLLARLPRGRVIAVDSSAEMVEHARAALGERATVVQADLAEVELGEQVDAVFSNAVIHWISDQDALFERLHSSLRPGGAIAAGCGAEGNADAIFSAAEAVAAERPFDGFLDGFERAWRFPGEQETSDRLRAAGFTDVSVWTERSIVSPRDPRGFLRTAPLRCHLERLPETLHDRFVQEVFLHCASAQFEFVRLQIEARRAL